MRRTGVWIFLIFIFKGSVAFGQHGYEDSLTDYLKDYVKNHEVVRGADKDFMQFFPVDENYRVTAQFKKSADAKWFKVETSGRERKTFRVYGTVTFTLHDTLITLNLYQGQDLLADAKYGDYLFLMFTDETTGSETYEAGRYLDLAVSDIHANAVTIDFNKAYNPYCAYVRNRYNCPIPPRENNIKVAVRAGEKNYAKKGGQ